jgi:hypothetical protein
MNPACAALADFLDLAQLHAALLFLAQAPLLLSAAAHGGLRRDVARAVCLACVEKMPDSAYSASAASSVAGEAEGGPVSQARARPWQCPAGRAHRPAPSR